MPLALAIVLAGCGDRPETSESQDRGSAAGGATGTAATGGVPGQPAGGLRDWVGDVSRGFREVVALAQAGDVPAARSRALDLYISRQEYIEIFYGAGGRLVAPTHAALATTVEDSETRFHELLQLVNASPVDSAGLAAAMAAVEAQHQRVIAEAEAAGVPMMPPAAQPGTTPEDTLVTPSADVLQRDARAPEIAGILEMLGAAQDAYQGGDQPVALRLVEDAYLERFEPIEPRLPAALSGGIERLFHLSLRPQLVNRAAPAEVERTFDTLRGQLLLADAHLMGGSTFLFGAINSFVIIAREGLEAVLLIAAILAYLARIDPAGRHQRRIYEGVGVGVAASLGTWVLARTLIPIGGAQRELIEGVTALLAVCVLVYVSNWLFQKTYIQSWREYLKGQVDRAVSTGSALVMAGLAFAAVYREGFETVLFYQALLFDVGSGAVLAGFLPGAIVILLVGVGIIRVGLRLPMRTFFGLTNALLLYLAFVFLGKGLYNLQEAGLFAPTPLSWFPDTEVLRLLLGVFPVAQTLLAQAVFLLLLVATYVYYVRKQALLAAAARPASSADRPARAVK
ncbi:MAG: FTR1 family iron permease [Gemmatimonadetes bacterium]|nr:FTR1 family iron permease [Gemmatimonadota bacterium]